MRLGDDGNAFPEKGGQVFTLALGVPSVFITKARRGTRPRRSLFLCCLSVPRLRQRGSGNAFLSGSRFRVGQNLAGLGSDSGTCFFVLCHGMTPYSLQLATGWTTEKNKTSRRK